MPLHPSVLSLAAALSSGGLGWGGPSTPAESDRWLPSSSAGAQADTLVQERPDTFRDPGARDLFRLGGEGRRRELDGIHAYEARLRERIYLGLRSPRFRRERGIVEEERVARFRWDLDGTRTIAWTGARRKVPLFQGSEEGEERAQAGLVNSLLQSVDPAALFVEPGDDRIVFGGNWALHPLADTAALHYRYASGDTLTLGLGEGRFVTLVELRVEPRESRFDRVAGSLWFDAESGSLVRASYRPARAFDLELDDPSEGSGLPGLLRPVRAEIRYITVDHSLHELRWWLPRRWALEGEAQVGRWAGFPLTLEWVVDDYRVNPQVWGIPGPGEEELPPGWSRAERTVERGGRPPRHVTVLVAPADSLPLSPELTGSRGSSPSSPVAFSPEEIREVQDGLAALLPRHSVAPPAFRWGPGGGMARYNRVEGLSLGAAGSFPLPRGGTFLGEARVGTGDRHLNVEGALRRGAGAEGGWWEVRGYRRAVTASDWQDPFTLGASLASVLWGGDRLPIYRTQGVEARRMREGRRTGGDLRVFAEQHRSASKETDFHLRGLFRERHLPGNIEAQEGGVAGVSGVLRWRWGQDPAGLMASGRLGAEVGRGEVDYSRGWTSVAVVHPLPFGTAGAFEGGVGFLTPDGVPQRRFYLGGSETLRGVEAAAVTGEAFWFVRSEVGTGLPALRITAFGDVGWAGPRSRFRRGVPVGAAGFGLSLLDGVLRVDVARQVRGGTATVLHAYLDGLF